MEEEHGEVRERHREAVVEQTQNEDTVYSLGRHSAASTQGGTHRLGVDSEHDGAANHVHADERALAEEDVAAGELFQPSVDVDEARGVREGPVSPLSLR